MFTHNSSPTSRRLRRVAVTASLSLSLALAGGMLASADADTPADWGKAPHVSGFDFLLVLLLIPVGIALVVSFLAFLPTLAGDHGYQPGQSWRGESQWFGGPTKGVEAADDVTHEQIEAASSSTGGTSGRW